MRRICDIFVVLSAEGPFAGDGVPESCATARVGCASPVNDGRLVTRW